MIDLYRFGVPFWGTMVAGVAAGLLGALAWRKRPKPGATALSITMTAATVWTWASAVGVTATDLASRLFWANFEWMAISVLPVASLWVCLAYTGRGDAISRLSGGFACSLPVLFTIVVWTDWFVGPPTGGPGLFREAATTSDVGGITILETTPGPVYWMFVGYAYVVVGAGLALLAEFWLDTETPYRRQAGAMFLAGGVPAASSILHGLGVVSLSGLDPTPITFLFTGAIGTSALARLDLLQAVPGTSRVAREAVVERMDDAVVVVDGDDRIVDCNTRAVAFLGRARVDALGESAPDLLPGYEETTGDGTATATVSTRHGEHDRFVDVRRTPFSEHGTEGAIVVLRDVTDRQRREQRLDVLNRVLRHNLRNDLNVVYGFVDHLMNRGEYDEQAMQTVKETTESLMSIGNKARKLERLLADDEELAPLSVVSMLEREIRRIRAEHPEATIDVEALPEATYCTGAIGSVARDILENAVEHNTAAEPHVWVYAARHGGELVFRVRDNGPGLPAEERAVLEEGRETGLEHGSGLGLWLVVWATRKMGGTVSFDQSPQGGCEVTVRVPAQDPPEEPVEPVHQEELGALDERVSDPLSPDGTREHRAASTADQESHDEDDDRPPLGQESEP
jgi:PAS domain S-box-containing protein